MPLPQYRHEYLSAAVSMGPIIAGTEWNLEITLANRGYVTEHFKVQFARARPSFETINLDDKQVGPRQTEQLVLAAEVDPGIAAWEVWWASIVTTSLNLVPTMRFSVQGIPGVAPPNPEFFFGPGDFAVFTLPPVSQSGDGTNASGAAA